MPALRPASAVLEQEFLPIRAKILEIAAALGRLDRADGSIELVLRPLPGLPIPHDDFAAALHDLFGEDAAVSVRTDPDLGSAGGKVIAWSRED